MISIRNQSSALQKGEFKELVLTNKQFVFERNDQQERIIVALNLDDQEFTISLNENLISLIDQQEIENQGQIVLKPKTIHYFSKIKGSKEPFIYSITIAFSIGTNGYSLLI